jgi:hypothetical protein
MESRKNNVKTSTRLSRAAELPLDFTKIVREVYTTNFSDGLKILKKHQKAKSAFDVRGAIFTDEIVLGISLITDGAMAATTIHCSLDFDPTASTPTAQDLLNICVDAIGSLYATVLDPSKAERIQLLADGALSEIPEFPLEWTKVEFDGRRVWLLVDKSNPTLDEMTDKWLAENDPEIEAEEDEHDEETADLFMTGKTKTGRGGPLH